jgi:hypothetical protein
MWVCPASLKLKITAADFLIKIVLAAAFKTQR